MKTERIEKIGKQLIDAVREHTSRALSPLLVRIGRIEKTLEERPEPIAGPPGPPGPQGERGIDGVSVDMQAILVDIDDAVKRAIDNVKLPIGPQGPQGERGEQGPQGERGETGADAQPIDMQEVARMIDESVQKHVSALTLPQGERGPQGEQGPRGERGEAGESVHIDSIRVMLSDMLTKAIEAMPKAKDGEPGRDATQIDVLPDIDESRSYPAGTYAQWRGGEIRAFRRTDAIVDGNLHAAGWRVSRDGISIVRIEQGDDEREISVIAKTTNGTKTETTFRMPFMIYRGVWREGLHTQGDVVTWDGSSWHCQRDTETKPGTGADWQLMVKRGADGKSTNRAKAINAGVIRVK